MFVISSHPNWLSNKGMFIICLHNTFCTRYCRSNYYVLTATWVKIYRKLTKCLESYQLIAELWLIWWERACYMYVNVFLVTTRHAHVAIHPSCAQGVWTRNRSPQQCACLWSTFTSPLDFWLFTSWGSHSPSVFWLIVYTKYKYITACALNTNVTNCNKLSWNSLYIQYTQITMEIIWILTFTLAISR